MTRSLRASEDGIEQIRKAMKGIYTQKALAEVLGISRSTITVLLRGEAIDRANFEELCRFLELDWRDIRGEEVVSDDLDLLVKEVKQKIGADVIDRCGTMRVLDMTQPVDLEQIYTDVNIIKDVTGRRRIGYDEVMEVCSREHFDRFLVGTIQERVTGLAAVEEFQKLVVLGKPGAGKTTFMKYLAMSCLAGKFYGELVPIFVTLKVYAETKGAPSLQEYIFAEFKQRKVSREAIERLLEAGKALILLDGLDEVRQEDDRRVKQDIDKFSRDWLQNRFAITCRIAAREYQFEKFTEVEVADFDEGQIETFVNNWFKEKDEPKAARLLEKLKDNQPVQELAKSPLLLTLLCLVFGDRNDLPPKRSELYKEGLEVLMKKWDAKRNIEREQIYKHLSPQNKEDMLGQIAFNTFVKSEYFFRQEDLQHQIKDYICNLPEAAADPEVLRVDSEVVLKAIEHHHGLLVERARNIYSFSHLTFQEYFTAREIERERKLETLIQHLTDPRWKEVFLLTAEMLRRSDDFLLMMKEAIDRIFAEDEKLQEVLTWAKQKADSVHTKYKLVAIRAFYFSTNRYYSLYYSYPLHYLPSFDLSFDFSFDLDLDMSFDHSLNFNLSFSQALYLDLVFSHSRLFSSPLKLDLSLSRSLDSLLDLSDVYLFLDRAIKASEGELQQALQVLKDQLPDSKADKEVRSQWGENNKEEWMSELRQLCIKHRNIGHDWQFTNDQVELLKKYYEANHLLVQCMNRSYVSKQVREEIESTLLLPREK